MFKTIPLVKKRKATKTIKYLIYLKSLLVEMFKRRVSIVGVSECASMSMFRAVP